MKIPRWNFKERQNCKCTVRVRMHRPNSVGGPMWIHCNMCSHSMVYICIYIYIYIYIYTDQIQSGDRCEFITPNIPYITLKLNAKIRELERDLGLASLSTSVTYVQWRWVCVWCCDWPVEFVCVRALKVHPNTGKPTVLGIKESSGWTIQLLFEWLPYVRMLIASQV